MNTLSMTDGLRENGFEHVAETFKGLAHDGGRQEFTEVVDACVSELVALGVVRVTQHPLGVTELLDEFDRDADSVSRGGGDNLARKLGLLKLIAEHDETTGRLLRSELRLNSDHWSAAEAIALAAIRRIPDPVAVDWKDLARQFGGVVYDVALRHVAGIRIEEVREGSLKFALGGSTSAKLHECLLSTDRKGNHVGIGDSPRVGDSWYVENNWFVKNTGGPRSLTLIGTRVLELDSLRAIVQAACDAAGRPRQCRTTPTGDFLRAFLDHKALPVLGPDACIPLLQAEEGTIVVRRRLSRVLGLADKQFAQAATIADQQAKTNPKQKSKVPPKVFLEAPAATYLKLVVAHYAPWLDRSPLEGVDLGDHSDSGICDAILSIVSLALTAADAFAAAMLAGNAAGGNGNTGTIAFSRVIRIDGAEVVGLLARKAVKAIEAVKSSEAQWAVGDVRGGIADRLRGMASSNELSLDDVSWLSRAVWHLLRFDAPYYPDSRSLTTQLEICVLHAKIRAPTSWPGSAALVAVSQAEVVTSICKWMSNLLPGHGSQPNRFYSVAHRLIRDGAYESWKRKNGRASILVVDTNLDQTLANDLELLSADISYAIVFPISIPGPNLDQPWDPAWAVRRRTRGSAEYEWGIIGPSYLQNALQISNIFDNGDNGIVVVKSHGAPLEPLEPLEELVKEDITHWKARAVGTIQYTHENYCGHTSGTGPRVLDRVSLDDVSLVSGLLHHGAELHPGDYVLPGGMCGPNSERGTQTQFWFVGYSLPDFARRVRMIVDGSMRPAPRNQKHHVVRSHETWSAADERFMVNSDISFEPVLSWDMLRSVAEQFGWYSK